MKVLAGSVLIVALISVGWIYQKMPNNRREERGYQENKKFFSQWYEKKPFKGRRGVALVVHGLNLRPEKMMTIIICLNQIGIDVLNVSLRGHGDNYRENGAAQQWHKDCRDAKRPMQSVTRAAALCWRRANQRARPE